MKSKAFPKTKSRGDLTQRNHHQKIPNLASNFMRGLLAIAILLGAFSLFYISSFPAAKWRLSDCPQANRDVIQGLRRRITGDGGGEEEDKTNVSHILFGIGGSAETWSRRRRYCELWWRPNVTRGYVWLDKKPKNPWPETSPPYQVSSGTAMFKYTNWHGSRSAIRIARIVKESFELGLENVRWFVMGDDDTVFFTQNLVDMLNRYDHNQMYYIGGNSESVEQNVVHSYTTAFGGGGFAVSYPLAAELVRILDGCIDRYASFYGSDKKIAGCVNEIGVPVTKELGFHQMDIRGSPFGLLSAHPIAPLISLHHLDYVHSIFPGENRVDSIKRLMQAYDIDPSRALQQTICYDQTRNWSVSIAWGYNVQLYPLVLTAKDLSTPLQTFLTWGTWREGPFTLNTRVLRFNPCERPLIYYLNQVNKTQSQPQSESESESGSGSESEFRSGLGTTTTWYKRLQPKRGRQCKKESYAKAFLVKDFNVTADVFDPETWKKGPRRQCCEIINGSDEVDAVMQVRIRSCNQFESVTLR